MQIRTAASIGLITLLALSGCAGKRGNYTAEQLAVANSRVSGFKAGNAYDQARQAYLAGDLDKARKQVDNSIIVNPSVPKTHVLRARILIEQSDLEGALQSLRTAEALEPTNVEAQYYTGIVYERFSQPAEALVYYKKAAELEVSNPQHAVAAAEMMIDLGKLDDAEEYLGSRTGSFEHNAGVRQTLGHIAMLKGDHARAAQLFNDARMLAPDDSGILEDLVQAQIATGRIAEAEFNLAKLMKIPENSGRRDLRHMQARCLLALDRPVEARELLMALSNEEGGSKDVETWIALGNVSFVLRDFNRVRMSASRVIALAPSRPEGYTLRALWHRQQGDPNSALRCADDAVARRGKDTEPLLLRAMLLEELEQTAAAQETYRQVLSEDPNNTTAKRALVATSNRQARVSDGQH
jgi:tetratricopeptide (TPR) repeat protein